MCHKLLPWNKPIKAPCLISDLCLTAALLPSYISFLACWKQTDTLKLCYTAVSISFHPGISWKDLTQSVPTSWKQSLSASPSLLCQKQKANSFTHVVTPDVVEHCWGNFYLQLLRCLLPFCCQLLYLLPCIFSVNLFSRQPNWHSQGRLLHSHAQHNSMASYYHAEKP